MGFLANLGSAYQGFQGAQDRRQQMQLRGLQIQQAQAALDEQKRQWTALAATAAPGGQPVPGGGGQPQPGPPQPASMVGPQGPPRAMPLPGAMPVPQGGGAPQPAAPLSPMPQSAAGPPPPQGAMGPQPGGSVQPPQGGGPAVSGVARPTGDPAQDSIATLRSIQEDIRRRNPGIDNLTLAYAVKDTLEMMKGVDPDSRALMKAQTEYYIKSKEIEEKKYGVDVGAQTKRDVAETQSKSREIVAEIAAKARIGAAGIGANARVQSATIGATSREDIARLDAAVKEEIANGKFDIELYKSDQNYKRSVDTALASLGKTGTTPAPQRPARPKRGGDGQRQPPPAPPPPPNPNAAAVIAQARQAIKQGRDRAGVVAKMKKLGVTPPPDL